MIRSIILIALALALVACGSASPVRVETVTVQVPVPVACISDSLPDEPPAPALTGDAARDTRLLASGWLAMRTAFRVLRAQAEPCRKEQN